jgi:hypothetical protein
MAKVAGFAAAIVVGLIMLVLTINPAVRRRRRRGTVRAGTVPPGTPPAGTALSPADLPPFGPAG